MRIASITMIGQFPHGINLHVRNLRWALTDEDHIFIITLPQFIKEFNLINDKTTTYIPFDACANTGFITFWREFPKIVKEYNINPEWFMFMEQDIWFFAKPVFSANPKVITSFLPKGDYRNVLFNKRLLHARVSECAQIIHGSIIQGAINFGIEFSFARETFVDKSKGRYSGITFSMPGRPDTMEELSLYCSLVKRTKMQHNVKASHLRGPESMHRIYPDVYQFATLERLKEIQNRMPYVDVLLAIAIYFLAGTWQKIDHLDWTKLRKDGIKDINRLLIVGKEWMTLQEYTHLKLIVEHGLNNRNRSRARS